WSSLLKQDRQRIFRRVVATGPAAPRSVIPLINEPWAAADVAVPVAAAICAHASQLIGSGLL
ncbi:MAG TPA: hypothetical protein VIU87_07535, partial [Mycobacterium sp.]